MEYRALGKTGLEVSVISFGAASLGNEYGEIEQAEGTRAVHCAIDQGINYFDVAPYYGRTLAETRLGAALAGRRNSVILATKVCRYDKTLETGFDFSAARVTASVEESLQRLRTDYIDVLQIHDIEFGDKSQIINETWPALFALKTSGKIRFAGITGYPLYMLAEVAEATNPDTILSYCRYNLMDTAMDAILTPVTRERNIGLINASTLHMRILTNREAPEWHPAPGPVRQMGREAAEFCRSQGVDIADLALQFALAHPTVATTCIGMSKVRHVEANLKALGTVADPALLSEVRRIIQPVANICWKSGRPENDDPEAV